MCCWLSIYTTINVQTIQSNYITTNRMQSHVFIFVNFFIYFNWFLLSQCKNCLQCDNDIYDCYVIDNNGYIILSNNSDDTGRFFGEVQAKAMKTLVDLQIFKAITVYDFQAVCKIKKEGKGTGSFANILSTVRDSFSF